jgi:hypothetical protein
MRSLSCRALAGERTAGGLVFVLPPHILPEEQNAILIL